MEGALREALRRPLLVAPMAGGPSTPGLVAAAAAGGALGFLAAGYRRPEELASEIAQVRALTDEAFGVNVFVPGPPAERPDALAAYLRSLADDEAALGARLGEPAWNDDAYADKIEMLCARPVPVVTFTFGCPSREVVAALVAAGSAVGVTVTGVDEAIRAEAAGAGLLCVQGAEAGAHRGCFANEPGALSAGRPLLALLGAVSAAASLPLVAAGGITTAGDLARALGAGAVAAQCGTAFLRCPESGAHPLHKAALADGRFTETTVTRAFSGRPARALVNRFVREHPGAPPAYPEVNSATRPLRAAAATAGDVERMSLWAGTGFRQATDRPAGEVVAALLAGR